MPDSLSDHEIRPDDLRDIELKLLKEDLSVLRKNILVEINCPACSRRKFSLMFTKYGFNFVVCEMCGTVFINPRPSSDSLEVFYTNSKYIEFWNKIFRDTEKIRKEKIFKPRIELVKKIFKKNKIQNCNKLIEVGSGHGWFCELAKKQQLAQEIVAIEPSPLFANVCRKIKGIQVIQSTIEKYVQRSHHELNVDVIVNFELIAHLFNPKSFIKSCYEILQKNGLLILSTPNFYGFDIQILKEKSDYISPNFLNYFNPNSITILLNSIGFRNIEVITPGLMDIHIILNKIKSRELKVDNYPFLNLVMKQNKKEFLDDFQELLQKHKMSSHMVVSAIK